MAADPGERGELVIGYYLIKRILFSLITLWLLSILVFAGGRMLPGDVGRAMLGPFADQKAVDVLNHEMGTDRPLLIQYSDWITGFVTGDLGKSYAYRAPVSDFLSAAVISSAKLALVAFLLVVPLSIFGGVIAALYRGRATDRLISVVGLSATIVPEFVSGIILILIFGVWLRWFPISATWPQQRWLFHANILSHSAIDSAGHGSLWLHRENGQGRHNRGSGRGIHANRHPQGTFLSYGDLPPRVAQCLAADHQRYSHADRLPYWRACCH